ncbi:hypothetical protein GH714_023914 [Hevea brasiliensis]|uniref:Cellulose synthase n=1 Tax=Hevea brasiliensis TaxID=3981 RepID=A0A6A6LQZ1_HEVBR|nr:hypothetical protein GH714_023914 [Hevea brasiliensis]
MATLQRAKVFRRQGSSGPVWDEKFLLVEDKVEYRELRPCQSASNIVSMDCSGSSAAAPTSCPRSLSTPAMKQTFSKGMESDEEIRRVPEFGGEPAGTSASGRDGGSVAGADRAQAPGEGQSQRKRGKSPADKENKRLKRLLRNRVSAQQARERKKAYLNELETRVKDLEKKNSELEERLSTLQNENQMLRHPKPLKNLNGQTCQICGDNVGLTASGDTFVACNECAFPVCRPCYEYERKDGTQSCPQCKTRYKRHKGNSKTIRQWQGEDVELSSSSRHESQQPIPLLTNGQPVSGEIPCATPDTQSVRTTSGPLGPPEKNVNSSPYIDPRQPVPVRIVDPTKDLHTYGLGNVDWKERVEGWKLKQEKNMMQMTNRYTEGKGDMEGTGSNGEELQMADDARQPLSRVVPIPSSHLTPYRVVIILRLIILGFFLQYRVTHPVKDAYPLWLTSVICEIWFALSWLLDQFPKWSPINRETYLDRLALRYDREGEPSQLAPVDVFVSTVDPLKEPPLVTANTVLSILAVDYPVDKVSCYVSDDGSAMLTFEALSETAEFARKWVPFCKKHNIEPRAPEFYFAQKIDYLKDKIKPSFVKERRAMKREYEEFKVRINALVAKAQKMPEEGWTMQDGTPWPGNNPRDHPGMIQVFLGHSGGLDTDGNELPRLVYVSREKRPGFQHHKKAGAMNALIRVSAVLTNGAYLLNVDCDHYFNNSKALKEAMCFMMDPVLGKKTCYVQFPQRFDGIDLHDRYANRNIVFFDINLKGLDGIQGPVYVGTGCCFNRQALYGYDPVLTEEDLEPNIIVKSCCGSRKKGRSGNKKYIDKKRAMKRTESTVPIFNMEDIEEGVEGYDDERSLLMSQKSLEKRFGQSPVFIAATFMEQGGIPPSTNPATLLKEAIHVISCGYEDKTEWGKEASLTWCFAVHLQ